MSVYASENSMHAINLVVKDLPLSNKIYNHFTELVQES